MLTPVPDTAAAQSAVNSALTAIVLADDFIAIIAALSRERDQWERLALDFGRAGYIEGYAEGYRARMREDDHEFAARLRTPSHEGKVFAEVAAARWELRGEARTRETFSQPHPQDR